MLNCANIADLTELYLEIENLLFLLMKVKLTLNINRVHPMVDQKVFLGIGQPPFVSPSSAATYFQRDLLDKIENCQLQYSYPSVESDLKGNNFFPNFMSKNMPNFNSNQFFGGYGCG
jgi:hypothetical protein